MLAPNHGNRTGHAYIVGHEITFGEDSLPPAGSIRSPRPQPPSGRLRRAVGRDLREQGLAGVVRKTYGKLRYSAQLGRYTLNLRRLLGGVSRAPSAGVNRRWSAGWMGKLAGRK